MTGAHSAENAEVRAERQRDEATAGGILWADRAHTLEQALREIIRREARSEYRSIYAAPGELARIARDALKAAGL